MPPPVFWFLALLVIVAVILASVASPPAKNGPPPERDDALPYELDGGPIDAGTLARLGTPDTVAELVDQGRGDELRGLGYDGELPPER